MSTLYESFSQVSSQIGGISKEIQSTEQEIARLSDSVSGDAAVRIEKLKEQIKKIDDYLLKIRGFQELAKKNLSSQNVLTIEAPPGYRVNLNRLRNWSMMIDPQSDNDPYAQRVYIVAKCDELFLENKKAEFSALIKKLDEERTLGTSDEVKRLRASCKKLGAKLSAFMQSQEMSDFTKSVVAENNKYWYKASPSVFAAREKAADIICPGAYAASLWFAEEQRKTLKSAMGDFYDQDGGRVLLPVEISNLREYVLTVTCSPAKRNKLDKALQNLILATINANPAGTRKIHILDGVRYNSSSIGSLRAIEGSFCMSQIPRNPDQLTAALEKIVSSFADVDELLEGFDSVAEYNDQADASSRIPLSTVIIFGWPNSYDGRDKDLIHRIMTNYERYGISLIIVSYREQNKEDELSSRSIPEYAMQNAVKISMKKNETTIAFPEQPPQRFTWYMFGDTLSDSFADSIAAIKTEDRSIGNEYPKRFSFAELPEYSRQYKKIELPYGIDSKDCIHSLSFENENFAAYLVGASRSGKSTLLHTLITGLIRNYHPDNLELWLADFKQLEFKKYIEHRPPHVKYILLDESPELVYDLIDKLTEKMLERQRLFATLGKERIDQVDPTALKEPLPVIFVILDEFSIMSQSIAESESYRLKLQNLLAKGAALGIKFLFSSQTFTTGIAGLTPTARAQIQQRISMKGSKEEISETLELSSNIRTEQVTNWIEALPPHYALVKHRISADALPVVNRVLVMYIPDYAKRDEMIEAINGRLTCRAEYRPGDMSSYRAKDPVIVDGNSYNSFSDHSLLFARFIDNAPKKSEFTGDELFLNVGTPRRMETIMPLVLAPESRENMLFIAGQSELACTASVLYSAMKSVDVQLGNVKIWAYGRDRLYRTYTDVWEKYDVSKDMNEICDSIRDLSRRIREGIEGNELIVFMGMERICSNFELAGDTSVQGAGMSVQSLMKSGAMVEQDDDEPDLFSFLNDTELPDEPETEETEAAAAPEPEIIEPEEPTGEYNAMEDFMYILRQGSRLGYHVVALANSLSDFKQTKLPLDLFRHRSSFSISKDDSWELFGNGNAVGMPEHICRYSDTMSGFSFRPYLHKYFEWDGWTVNEVGEVVNIL